MKILTISEDIFVFFAGGSSEVSFSLTPFSEVEPDGLEFSPAGAISFASWELVELNKLNQQHDMDLKQWLHFKNGFLRSSLNNEGVKIKYHTKLLAEWLKQKLY